VPLLDFLYTARPTAVNLGAATRRLTKTIQASIDAGKDAEAIAKDLIAEGKQIADEDVGRNKEMAKWGGESGWSNKSKGVGALGKVSMFSLSAILGLLPHPSVVYIS
jgi:hypothetical protein